MGGSEKGDGGNSCAVKWEGWVVEWMWGRLGRRMGCSRMGLVGKAHLENGKADRVNSEGGDSGRVELVWLMG